MDDHCRAIDAILTHGEKLVRYTMWAVIVNGQILILSG